MIGRAQHIAVVERPAGWKLDDATTHCSLLEFECDRVGVRLSANGRQRGSVQFRQQQNAGNPGHHTGTQSWKSSGQDLGQISHTESGQQGKSKIGNHCAPRNDPNTLKHWDQVITKTIEEKVPAQRVTKSDYRQNQGQPKRVTASIGTNSFDQISLRRDQEARVSQAQPRQAGHCQNTERGL